jgi:hypothetical protein
MAGVALGRAEWRRQRLFLTVRFSGSEGRRLGDFSAQIAVAKTASFAAKIVVFSERISSVFVTLYFRWAIAILRLHR